MRTMLKIALAAACLLAAGAAQAETYEVRMLNRGEHGAMPFEPDFLRLQPGDAVKFLATHPTHNAASMRELLPDGAERFLGKIDEEVEITFTVPGIYGIRCVPHIAQGMVMLIIVGDEPLETFTVPDGLPPLARRRFEEIVARYAGQ